MTSVAWASLSTGAWANCATQVPVSCPGITGGSVFYDKLNTIWYVAPGALQLGANTTVAPYTDINPVFANPTNGPFDAQLDQTQIQWSVDNGFSGTRSKTGQGFYYDYYQAPQWFADEFGTSIYGKFAYASDSFAQQSVSFRSRIVAPFDSLSSGILTVPGTSLPLTGFVAPGGRVEVQAVHQVGYGSYGGLIYNESKLVTITTPGEFSTTINLPEAAPLALLPNNGDFAGQTFLLMRAYPGTDGITPTHVSSGPPGEGDDLTIDTSVLHSTLPAGAIVDFGVRRIGTVSPQSTALRLTHAGAALTQIYYEVPDDVGGFQTSAQGPILTGDTRKLLQNQPADIGFSFAPFTRGVAEHTIEPPNASSLLVLKGIGVGPDLDIHTPDPNVTRTNEFLSGGLNLDLGNVVIGTTISRTFGILNSGSDPDGGDSSTTSLTIQAARSPQAYLWNDDQPDDDAPIVSRFQIGGQDLETSPVALLQGNSASLTIDFDASNAVLGRQYVRLDIDSDEGRAFGDLDFDRSLFLMVNVVAAGSPGDYNSSGTVDAADYAAWRAAFGQTGAGLATDGNGNGVVDAADYTVWRDRFDARSSSRAGDYNYNGVVDAADYTTWRDSLGSQTNLAADGNANGIVDTADYLVWTTRFNNSSAARAALNSGVPEPATLIASALASVVAGFTRRRRCRHASAQMPQHSFQRAKSECFRPIRDRPVLGMGYRKLESTRGTGHAIVRHAEDSAFQRQHNAKCA